MSNETTNTWAPARQGVTEATSEKNRKPWCSPTLNHVGHIGDILQTGGGKISTTAGDPGEPRKPPGGTL